MNGHELGQQARVSGSKRIVERVHSVLLDWEQEFKRWKVADEPFDAIHSM